MNKLQMYIRDIWSSEIKKSYQQGIICSERHLQAEIYRHFKNHIDLKEYQMWVEPVIELFYSESENANYKPDLVISKDNDVICFIEIKYVPYNYVDFLYDIEKLRVYQQLNSEKKFPLKTDPKTGNWSKERYSIVPNVLSVFAVIAKHDAWAHGPKNYFETELEQSFPLANFLVLKGKTNSETIQFEAGKNN